MLVLRLLSNMMLLLLLFQQFEVRFATGIGEYPLVVFPTAPRAPSTVAEPVLALWTTRRGGIIPHDDAKTMGKP